MQTIEKKIIECNSYYLIQCRKNCGIGMLTEDELYSYNQTCEDCYLKREK